MKKNEIKVGFPMESGTTKWLVLEGRCVEDLCGAIERFLKERQIEYSVEWSED